MHPARGSASAGSPDSTSTAGGGRGNGSASHPQGAAATSRQGTATATATSSKFAPVFGTLVRQASFPPPLDPATTAQSVMAAGARWPGVGAPAAGPEQSHRPLWASDGHQRSPALAPTAAPAVFGGGGGVGGGGATPFALSGLHASPPLAPIGSNRHRRQHSDGSGSSSSAVGGAVGGSCHRGTPGLSPASQPAGSFLSLEASAEQPFMLSSARDPDLDNMDTFATASAVAAGVLDTVGDGGGGGGGYGSSNGNGNVAAPPSEWEAALDAGAGDADHSRHGRSFSVPIGNCGQNNRASPGAAGGEPYGEQQDLAIGGSCGVFDHALERGHFGHQHGGRACRAPAGTIGGSGGVGFDGGRGSRLGLYMSSSAGNSGGGGGGGGGAQGALPEAMLQFETPHGGSLYFGGSPSSGAGTAGGPDALGFKEDGDHKYGNGGGGKGCES